MSAAYEELDSMQSLLQQEEAREREDRLESYGD